MSADVAAFGHDPAGRTDIDATFLTLTRDGDGRVSSLELSSRLTLLEGRTLRLSSFLALAVGGAASGPGCVPSPSGRGLG